MSYINNNATYGSSSYGVNGLSSSFSSMGFQPAGGASYSSIAAPQQQVYTSSNNVQVSQYSSLPSTTSYTTTSVLPATTFATPVAAPIVAAPVAGNMLPAPINDGRRYARLTGQKAGSRRSRRHLVQPLNGTGLQTLPAGIPVEGLAANQAQLLGGGSRRSRRNLAQPLNQTRGLNNSAAGFPGTTSNYVSLGSFQSGSALPLQQQQQFVSAPVNTSSTFVSAPATSTTLLSAPIVSAPIFAAPVASNMLPAPINDGRRYARLTGQKAGSRRSRRHLVQPLNGTGLQTLPAGIPVEGLAAAALPNNGRRSRRMASRGLNNGSVLSAAPLATTGLATSGFAAPLASSIVAPVGTSMLAQPHLAQIPLGAPKAGRAARRNRNAGLARAAPLNAASLVPVTTAPVFAQQQGMVKQVYAPVAQAPLIGGATF